MFSLITIEKIRNNLLTKIYDLWSMYFQSKADYEIFGEHIEKKWFIHKGGR